MIRRVPDQRQQIAAQIEDKGRLLGRIHPKNAKVYQIKQSENVPDGGQSKPFTWRKKVFYYQQGNDYTSIGDTNFSYWATIGNDYTTTLISSEDGSLKEFNIPQFANIAYDIEVFRKSPTTITIPIRCVRSLAIEVDDVVVYDSGDSSPNSASSVTINLAGQKWTRITIYFYTGFARTDDNYIIFDSIFRDIIEQSRLPVPEPPIGISASNGEFTDSVLISWSVVNQAAYEFFQVWYSSSSDGTYYIANSAITGDRLSYVHNGLESNTHYWYKVRGVTSDGDVTDFIGPIEGYTSSVAGVNRLTIDFASNETFLNDENSAGYYALGEDVMFSINTSSELPSDTYPDTIYCQVSGFSNLTNTDTIYYLGTPNYDGRNSLSKFNFTVSGTFLDEVRGGKVDVFGYTDTTECVVTNNIVKGFSPIFSDINSWEAGTIITGYDLLINSGCMYFENDNIYASHLDVTLDLAITGHYFGVMSSVYALRYTFLLGTMDTTNKTFTVTYKNYLRHYDSHSNTSEPPNYSGFKFHIDVDLDPNITYGFLLIASEGGTPNELYASGRCTRAFLANSKVKDYYIIDADIPTLSFTIDGDGVFDGTQDAYTNTSGVYIVLDRNVSDGLDNSFYDSSGNKYSSGIYKIAFANVQNDLNNLDITGYIDYSPKAIYSYNLQSSVPVTGYGRRVWARIWDKAGNYATASDTIFYITGYVNNVVAVQTGWKSFYDKNWVHWQKPTTVSGLAGYEIYRKENDNTTPLNTDPVYAVINDINTSSFFDYWGNASTVKQNTTYYYWLKAKSEMGLRSSGFSNIVSGHLCDTGPAVDDWVSISKSDNAVKIVFSNNSANTPSGRNAINHYIYRNDSTLGLGHFNSNSQYAGLVNTTGLNETFIFYDLPPCSQSSYQYFSIPENLYGYRTTGGVEFSSTFKLSNGSPAIPSWSTTRTKALPWGVILAWDIPTETDVVAYTIYRKSGEHSTFSAGDTAVTGWRVPYTYNSDATKAPYYFDANNAGILNSKQTYWIQAHDNETPSLSSFYSSALVTGAIAVSIAAPVWVTGESYAWYGYNHLTFSGYAEPYGTLAGYKLYRNTINDTSTMVQIATIEDNRSIGGKVSWDDISAPLWISSYYWVRAFNTYNIDGILSAVSNPYMALPNFDTLFSNYLDNSSFERDLDTSTQWHTGTILGLEGFHGSKSAWISSVNPALYSGYIFVQVGQRYHLSFFVKRTGSPSTCRISGLISWFGPDRSASALSSTGFAIDYTTSNPASWTRVYNSSTDNFTAPAGATNASISISTNNGNFYIDAVQFEKYLAGESPRSYVDSRTISADRMQAHIIIGDMIQFDTLTGDKIKANEISGYHIKAGSITTDKLDVLPGTSMLPSGFYDTITSGTHNIYVSGRSFQNGSSIYNVLGVHAVDGGTAVGHTFTATGTNYGMYYAYYDRITDSGYIRFSDKLTSAVAGDFIIGQFLHSNPSDFGGGFMLYQGPYAGPGIQMHGSQITAGNIHGDFITASSIRSSRLDIGFAGLVQNNIFERWDGDFRADAWTLVSGTNGSSQSQVFFKDTTTKLYGNAAIRASGFCDDSSPLYHITTERYIPAINGEIFAGSIFWKANASHVRGNIQLLFQTYNSAYTLLTTYLLGEYSQVGSSSIWARITGWNTIADASCAYVRPIIRISRGSLTPGANKNDITLDCVNFIRGAKECPVDPLSDISTNINGAFIDTFSIRADKLQIGYIRNLLQNPSFERYNDGLLYQDTLIPGLSIYNGGPGWVKALEDTENHTWFDSLETVNHRKVKHFYFAYNNLNDNIYNSTGTMIHGRGLLMMSGGQYYQLRTNDKIPVEYNTNYKLSSYFMISTPYTVHTTGYIGVILYDENGNYYDGAPTMGNWTQLDYSYWGTHAHTAGFIDTQNYQSSVWVRTGYDLMITDPNVKYIKVVIGILSENAGTDTPYLYFNGVQLEFGNSLTDFTESRYTTINNGDINTNAITAEKIRSNTIESNHIQANSITASKILAESIRSHHIYSNTISGVHIGANTISAKNMIIKSANLLKNAQFSRISTLPNSTIIDKITDYSTLWSASVDGKFYKDTSTVFLNEGHTVKYENPAGTYSFGSYIRSSRYVPIDITKPYSFAMWLKWQTSPVVARSPKITLYQYDADFNYLTSDISTIQPTFSVANDIWYCVTGCVMPSQFNPNTKYVQPNFFGDYYGTPQSGTTYKNWYGQVTMCEGWEAVTGFAQEGITVIDGSYIKTGILDADLVTISSATSQITLASGGMTVNYQNDAGYGYYTSIGAGDLSYIAGVAPSTTGEMYFYPKRRDYLRTIKPGGLHTRFIFNRGPMSRYHIPDVTVRPICGNYNNNSYPLYFPHRISATGFSLAYLVCSGLPSINGLSTTDMTKNVCNFNPTWTAIPNPGSSATINTTADVMQYRYGTFQKSILNIGLSYHITGYTGIAMPDIAALVIRLSYGRWAGNTYYSSGEIFMYDYFSKNQFPAMFNKRVFRDNRFCLTPTSFDTESAEIVSSTGWGWTALIFSSYLTGNFNMTNYAGGGCSFIDLSSVTNFNNTANTIFDVDIME